MNNILITGAAGFIGFHLAKFHEKKGDKLFLLDNFFKSKSKDIEFKNFLKKKNVFFFNVDLTKKINLKSLKIKNFDVVYHLAAINGTSLFYKIPNQVFSSNIKMTLNFFDWLRSKKINRLIYSSSSEVYSQSHLLGLLKVPTNENAIISFKQPINDRMSYGLSKFFGEFYLTSFIKSNKIKGCIVRFHNIYGPRMGDKHVIPEFIDRARKANKVFKIYGGKQTRAFCYIDDAIKFLYSLGRKKKISYNLYHIGNPKEEIKISFLAKKIINLNSKKLKIIECGEPAASVDRRCPDIKKVMKETGYKIQFNLESGLNKTFNWYLKNQ